MSSAYRNILTSLTAGAASGAGSVTVENALTSAIVVGSNITIGSQTVTVTSVTGNVINFTPALGSAVPAGTNVTSYANSLDPAKAYWSVSTASPLGVAGQIQFQNRDGGSMQKVKDQFTNINTLMQNLTSILGANDDLFNSTLNLIR